MCPTVSEPVQHSIRTDIRCLRHLSTLGKLLAIFPSKSCWRYPHSAIVITLFLSFFVYSMFGKLYVYPDALEKTAQFTDVTLDVVSAVSIIAGIVVVNLLRGKCFEKFVENFEILDVHFRNIHVPGRPCLCYFVEVIGSQVLFVLYYICDCNMWISTLGFSVYKFYLSRLLQNYHLLVLALLLRFYALALKYRFEHLNKILCKFNRAETTIVQIESRHVNKVSSYANEDWCMKKIINVYTALIALINQYNTVFGICFVCMYFWIVSSLMMPINIALVYGSGEKDLLGNKFGSSLILLCIFWCLLPLGIMMMIFSACENCSAEAAKVPNICYIMMSGLSDGDKDKMLKDDLQELANQAINSKPTFSAAGYFNVNYSLAFTMIGSISSYLIVLIQLHRN